MTVKPANLHLESIGLRYTRQVMQMLTESKPLCNTHQLKKPISREKEIALMVELIAREPRPAIDHASGWPLRRAIVKGDGTKKSPYVAEWLDDFFIDT